MKLTWYGHSAYKVQFGNAVVMIDPFLDGNPSWDGGWEEPSKDCTHVLLTHGHDDHLGNAYDICKATNALLVANFEICMHAVGQGISDQKINPANPGGTVRCGGFTTSFVQAVHSSSTQTGKGENLYLGAACGLILKAEGEKSLYHMGDTDIFGDMALIQELHEPSVGLVPIGDRFTMGASEAALACTRFFDFETIIPCHYGSFPVIDPNAEKFIEAVGDDAGTVKVMQVGETIEI
ncbi:MAG: metal-dependent hydrolase [Rhizobiaceae bacterium]|nr:metal-dependent hydrolase [Rhizobiaceae bacterium]